MNFIRKAVLWDKRIDLLCISPDMMGADAQSIKILSRQFYEGKKKKKIRICWKLPPKMRCNFHLLYFKSEAVLRTITGDTMRKISSLQELSILRWTWANCKRHHPGTIIWSRFPFKESHINGRSAFHCLAHLMPPISPQFHWPEHTELTWVTVDYWDS